ncbi:hypothetical protein Tco_1147520 [Tanacetum coccineum]
MIPQVYSPQSYSPMYAAPHLSQPKINHSSIPPSHQYQSQMNHQTSCVPQNAYHSPQVSTQPMTEFPQLDSCLVVLVFNQGDDPIACLNKEMAFMPLFKTSGLLCNKFKEGKDKVMLEKLLLAQAQESGHVLDEEQLAFLVDLGILDGQAAQTSIPNNAAFQTEDLDANDSDCDDVFTAHAILMASLSNYGLNVISEVPHSEPYHNDMDNQSVHAMHDFEQPPVVDFLENKITSDSNIISYSQYLQETQQAAVQDTNLYAQQDSMILSMIEQMSEQMINLVNN